MPWVRNTTSSYSVISKCLHWFSAFLMLTLIPLGYYMVQLTYYDPLYHQSLSWHKALGMILGALAIIKLFWLFISPSPHSLLQSSTIIRLISKAVHIFLFSSTLLLPISGYIISTSAGDGIDIFGMMSIPAFFEVSDSQRELAITFHYYAAYGITAFIFLHAAAAIKHQFIEKDNVLRRMTW